MNKLIIIIFVVQIFLSSMAACLDLYSEFQLAAESKYDYLGMQYFYKSLQVNAPTELDNVALVLWGLQSFGRWFIVLSNLMSISLILTLETVKVLQGEFIKWDIDLVDTDRGITAKV